MPASVSLARGPLAGTSAPVVALLVRAASGADRGAAMGRAPTGSSGGQAGATALAFGVDLAAQLLQAGASGKAGEVVEVPLTRTGTGGPALLLLAGTGDLSPTALRRAGAALARRSRGRAELALDLGSGVADDRATDLGSDQVRALVEGVLLAAYARPRRGAADQRPERAPLESLVLHADPATTASGLSVMASAVASAVRTATAAHQARDLANTTADLKTPDWLAAQARALCEPGVRVSVRHAQALRAEGFGGLLAVGAGSASPPCLIELGYSPRARPPRGSPHVVLVGKGITFDSGGLSLKPSEAMLPMKTDMTGGGVVIAVLAALRDLDAPLRVTGLVAAAENLPGAAALRPGDVITQYGGRTVEVFNTDAEGRLVLADALAYADERLEPDVLLDIATLTGAASLGLGRRHGALYTDDDALAAQLIAAGAASGERLWRMPLVEDYRAALDSDIADLSHIARDPHVGGGSITAALFLREFAGGRRWAHLDIAGPARSDGDEHEVTKGGTGFGARILLRWLESLAAA